jgi:competence protein ComEC
MPNVSYHFLDVGMGDSTLVIIGDTLATQELVLIDYGVQPFTKFKIGADDAELYLVDTINKISKARKQPAPFVDHLVITHPDQDHYNRLVHLVKAKYEDFPNKELWFGDLTYGGYPSKYGGGLITFLTNQVVNKQKVGTLPNACHSKVNQDGSVEPFRRYANGDVLLYLLSANYPTLSGPTNQLSVCLMFKDQDDNKVILMGDAEWQVENAIIGYFQNAEPDFLQAYGLKLGHHGSLNGTSDEWIDAVQPDAIFATGDMVWAHPYCNAIQRVIDKNILGTMDDHRYCCGISGGEYFNNEKTLQICLNLWYVVKDVNGEAMIDHDGDVEMAEDGWTYGVQWELEFRGAGDREIAHTDTSNPQ